MANKKIPLIIEEHPDKYDGYKFITLINYNDRNYLSIVDNVTKKHIVSYVLDLCTVNNVDEGRVIDVAIQWYDNFRNSHPISVEFAKLGIGKEMSCLIKMFSFDYVTRVIGPLPKYNMGGPSKIRKRKRKPVPKNMTFSIKKLS